MKITLWPIVNKFVRGLLYCSVMLTGFVMSSASTAIAKPDIASTTSALELNKLRIGDDYRIFNMVEGAKARACERACQKETKCRAWTFIRERVKRKNGMAFNLGNSLSFSLGGNRTERIIPAQCRLKYDVGPAVPNECCISGVVRNMDKNARGEEDTCARLANRAVSQNDRNLAGDCGLRGRSWHGSYSQHYDHCIQRGADQFKGLAKTRDDALSLCAGSTRSRREGRNPRCQVYADSLVSMNEANIKSDCGLSGSFWHSEFDKHYLSCQRKRDESADKKQILQARGAIKLCLARGGGAYNRRCNDFASNAIKQQRKNIKNKCGFSGQRWHDNYKRHYQSCRKLSDWRRARDQKSRIRSLSQCIRDRKSNKAICHIFADKAVRDQDRNVRLGCKLEGKTRWHTNLERHLQICMALSDRERRLEMNVRRAALDKCERDKDSGSIKDAFCKEYAAVAVDQNRENVKSRCRYMGPLWSDRYRDHYAWCLRHSENEARTGRRTRRDSLIKCQSDGHFQPRYNKGKERDNN